MEDVTGFFNEAFATLVPKEDQIPALDLWIELYVSGRTVISGVISNHTRYPDGMRILTSSIQGYETEAGITYAMTKNSKYQLGERLEVVDQSHFLSAVGAAQVVSSFERQTVC
jgi:hypothetical protein